MPSVGGERSQFIKDLISDALKDLGLGKTNTPGPNKRGQTSKPKRKAIDLSDSDNSLEHLPPSKLTRADGSIAGTSILTSEDEEFEMTQ